MEYQFEKTRKNYEHFASGRVLYNAHGTTSFPVRLGSEIIQRCFHILRSKGNEGPYTVYDPCCGGAYLLTIIGLLHRRHIKTIFASDINHELLDIAGKNLSLLSSSGMETRKKQLQQLFELYNKASHLEALESADYLTSLISNESLEEIYCFQADITAPKALHEKCSNVDIVIADLPYGEIVSWQTDSTYPVTHFF
ncbi:hypothetical protein [Paenibacillus alkalitolerans]|uniref:hypothetical protein n=1 Tax=Paenibacillus alkalitolerans TaxID=2799335 RepID=UPI0022790F80|nr:hypothetical protein [Paenibacillus alkalitolerans]